MLYSIFRFIAALIFRSFFGLKVSGQKNVPKKGGFILVSNHTSYLDPIVLGVATPRKLNFMAKEELFSNQFFYWFFYKLRAFPIKRNSADLSALKEAIRRVKNGNALVVFPEGSRRFDGITPNPQPGVGFLVARLNVPVIPAYIRGTDRALPRGAKFIRPNEISVYFGKQISIERRTPYQAIAQLIMEHIRHLS